jgi:hypothetical protein
MDGGCSRSENTRVLRRSKLSYSIGSTTCTYIAFWTSLTLPQKEPEVDHSICHSDEFEYPSMLNLLFDAYDLPMISITTIPTSRERRELGLA